MNDGDFPLRPSQSYKLKCREVDYETAKKEIVGCFQMNHEAYPDEISQDLELDFDLVRQITAELKKEGRLEVV